MGSEHPVCPGATRHRIARLPIKIVAIALFLFSALFAYNAHAQGNYQLGAGDTISITVVHSPELSVKTRIDAQGDIHYPYLGKLNVTGLTPGQAANKIAIGLQNAQIINNPQVLVNVDTYRSEQITVIGQVRNPGNYPLESDEDLINILAQAGGVTKDGADYVIVTRKTGGKRLHIQLSMKDLATGDQHDVTAHAGDVIYVPKMQVFYIEGSVNKPGSYRYEPGMTVMQAIALGGGLTPRGSDSRIELTHHRADGKNITKGASLNTKIQPNDVIRVKERIF